ncbi:MAG: hypothetical protein AB2761_20940 [Candidatus Thiodiazotropha endolucinida]
MKFSVIKLITIITQDLSYCDPALKDAFHQEGKKVFRHLAKLMGIKPDDYDVRSNKAGIAVSGEVTLHTASVYVQLSQPVVDGEHVLLMRSCQGRDDYTGGMNHFAPAEALQDLNRLAVYLEGVSRNQVCGMYWNPDQVRIDVAHIRANKIISPELERVRDRFEADEIPIEAFEYAIESAERRRMAA